MNLGDHPADFLTEAKALQRQGDFAEAEVAYRRVLALEPDNAEALNNLGNVLRTLKRPAEAVFLLRKALAARPEHPAILSNLGLALGDLRQFTEAAECHRRAVAIDPKLAPGHNNLGLALKELGLPAEAEESYRRALALNPDFAEALNNLGNVLRARGRLEESIAAFERAVALKPSYADAYNNLGNALSDLGRLDDAEMAYRRSIALAPDGIEVHANLARSLVELGRLDEAATSLSRAAALDSSRADILSEWLFLTRRLCDWEDAAAAEASLRAALASGNLETGRRPPSTFSALIAFDDPALQFRAARLSGDYHSQVGPTAPDAVERHVHDRLRVAYLSADFCNHPTSHLIAELIERHDRTRFEVFGLSLGPDDKSPMRQRLGLAFDHFIDVRDMDDAQVAGEMRRLEIDIAVDLMGYSKNARPGILARRPCSIQVNYLGYPGSMGAAFIDYIIVDPFVVPQDQQAYFSENLVHLPDCYQVNDRRRPIAERTPTREECGLPERGFVFCSFNNSYKITATYFDVWSRLLRTVPESALWLLADNEWAEANLRREASARGLDPKRLVFARRLPLADHLARHRLADLFLDTLPCNAHTTASDALWAGLPVVSCAGHSFPARVAGSLLHAIGLPELVVHNLGDYEALALRLAREPDRLGALKARLQLNRAVAPLFDTDRYRRHIEAAYLKMHANYWRGEAPRAFNVSHTKTEEAAMSGREFVFTMSTGRSGTQYLAELLHSNLPEAECHHEILGWDRFGVDTPDLSHMTLFNSQGNVDKVRAFWRQKLARIGAGSTPFYAETSHLLMKAGLIENLQPLSDLGRVHLIALERDAGDTIISFRNRFDFYNKGSWWLWYLDPAYPKNLTHVDPAAMADINGICLWYIYEIRVRAAYYKRLCANVAGIVVHRFTLEEIRQRAGAARLLNALGIEKSAEAIELPPPQNVGRQGIKWPPGELERIREFASHAQIDVEALAEDAIRKGWRF